MIKSHTGAKADKTNMKNHKKKTTQEKRNPPPDKEAQPMSPEKQETVFRMNKFLYGGMTWFFCVLLLIPCYIETKITAMLFIIPFLILLGIGFYRQGKMSYVEIKDNLLAYNNVSAFKKEQGEIEIKQIKKLILNVYKEDGEEIVYSIKLLLQDGAQIPLPDIDKKDSLKESLLGINPDISVDIIS